MITLSEVEARLRTAATQSPGAVAMQHAAERAAQRANAVFAGARYPARVLVVRRGTGWRLQLSQTARVTRPLSGKTPMQIVRDALAIELPGAKQEILADVQRILHP